MLLVLDFLRSLGGAGLLHVAMSHPRHYVIQSPTGRPRSVLSHRVRSVRAVLLKMYATATLGLLAKGWDSKDNAKSQGAQRYDTVY